MDKLFENWRNFTLTEARRLPSILNTLLGGRENIHTVGIMTAENPGGLSNTSEENEELNNKLAKDLKMMNLGYRKIRGSFGNKEKSFLIPNIRRDEIVELGKKYGQVSVIWGNKTKNGFLFDYIEDGTTKQQRDVILFGKDIQSREDFYSQEPRGPGSKAGKFVIPFFDDEYEILEEDYKLDEQSSKLNEIFKEINERLELVLQDNRTPKFRWEQRGLIKELKKSISIKK